MPTRRKAHEPDWFGNTDAALERIYAGRRHKNQLTAVAIAIIFAMGWIGFGWMTKPLPTRLYVKTTANGVFMFDSIADSARFCRMDNDDIWCTRWSAKEAVEAALR